MKVKDLFEINKEFSEFKVLAGENGLDRELLNIDVFEIPDGAFWAETGEFLITTGYYYHDNPEEFVNVLETFCNKNSAGLGIKLGRFIDELPDIVINKANELNFPLLSIPVNMGYSDLIWPVVSLLLGESSYDDFIINKFKKELNSTAKEKYYLNNIILLLNNYLNSDIYLIEKEHLYLIKSLPSEKDYTLIHNLIVDNDYLSNDIKVFKEINNKWYRIYKIFHHGIIYGYFGIVSDEFDESKTSLEIKFLDEVYTHIVIHILNYTRNKIESIKSIDGLFYKIIQGIYIDEEINLQEEAKLLNVDYHKSRIVMTLSNKNNNYQKKNIAKYLREIFVNKIKDFYVIEEINCLTLIMSVSLANRENLKKIASDIILKLNIQFPEEKCTIGISKVCSSLKYLHSAAEESSFAEKIGITLKKDIVYFYDDYIIYHMLSKLHNHPSVQKVYRNILTKIRNEKSNGNEELVKTLKALARNAFNITKTSENLYIHRNTLYKRINRIQKIIGMDFKKSDTKFILTMVTKLDDLIS